MNKLVVSMTSLIGDRVHDLEGHDIGRIEDILLDAERGRIAYAVLSSGSEPGASDDASAKFFAVPWEAIRVDSSKGGDGLILDVDQSRLDRAPTFEKDNWPNFADPQYANGIYRHYGIPPYWEQGLLQ